MKIRLFSSKKGQFYILIALLLITYAFGLSRQDVPIRKPQDNFKLLHGGFMTEGAAVINSAIYEEANVSSRFSGFTDNYLAYARSSEPGFRLLFLLKQGSLLTVGNRLNGSVNITVSNASYIVPSSSDVIVTAGTTSVALFGLSYTFYFSSADFELKGYFQTSDKLARRIFVSG